MHLRNRILILLIVFGVLAGGTWWYCRVREVHHIERVLIEDRHTGASKQSAAYVVTKMRAIDLSGCPADFRLAYLRHIHAWESMAGVEQEVIRCYQANNSWSAIFEEAIRGALGDALGVIRESNAESNQLRQGLKLANTAIEDTWHRLQETALAHGATLSKDGQ